MTQPKINPQGTYAGLAPAIPGLAGSRPRLGAKLKRAAIATGGSAASIPPTPSRTTRNSMKA